MEKAKRRAHLAMPAQRGQEAVKEQHPLRPPVTTPIFGGCCLLEFIAIAVESWPPPPIDRHTPQDVPHAQVKNVPSSTSAYRVAHIFFSFSSGAKPVEDSNHLSCHSAHITTITPSTLYYFGTSTTRTPFLDGRPLRLIHCYSNTRPTYRNLFVCLPAATACPPTRRLFFISGVRHASHINKYYSILFVLPHTANEPVSLLVCPIQHRRLAELVSFPYRRDHAGSCCC